MQNLKQKMMDAGDHWQLTLLIYLDESDGFTGKSNNLDLNTVKGTYSKAVVHFFFLKFWCKQTSPRKIATRFFT